MQFANDQIQHLVGGLSKNGAEILALKLTKLDSAEFEEKIKTFDDQLETIRYATYDSFRALKATDNYLEKYLPFLIQNLISANFKFMLVSPPKNQIDEKTGTLIFAPDRSEWTAKQKKEYEFYESFKENEYEIYKGFHSAVLNDDGNPKLKKTGFKVPGYRTVLGKKLDEYEIDNDILYHKAKENETVSEDANIAFIVPEEAIETGQSFNVSHDDVSS